ncbi:MAG: Gfo/Idh/MocA family oxidoreductase [Stappiaceae bacterium]
MLNVAIIGCGDMGNKHATAWTARPDASVVAVCDVNAERGRQLAEKLQAQFYGDWREAIADPQLDVVSICTPACTHHDIAVAAAGLGNHVLCEKSMALNLPDAEAMIAAADAQNVHLQISHQYRGLSRYKIMKKLVDEGTLGSPVFIRFMEMREVRPKLAMHRKSQNGGPVHDMSGHLFDLARFFIDREPESVTATGTVFGKGKSRLAEVEDFGIDVAEIQVRFAGGHCLSIGINWGLPEGTPSYSHEAIYGPNGVAHTQDSENADLNLGEISATTNVIVKNAQGTTTFKCEADFDGPEICIDEFMARIASDTPSLRNGKAGYDALKLIMATLESIESGRTVHLS